MKNHLRKTAASLIIAIMISSFPLYILASQKAESGTVRILLTDLQLISRIDIGIFGSYLMNDNLSFQNGSQLIVTENQNGLMIYYEGARIQGSKSIVLKRYDRPNDTENGLRINNKLNLYEGDLIITQSDQGLRVILHIGIEDY